MAAELPFELGEPGPMRDGLLAAVRRGEKTATTALLAQYELENEPLPRVGERRLLLDSDGQPTGYVVLTKVAVIRLGDADDQLAHEEGEGFASVTDWREAHETFWRRHVVSALPTHHVLDDDTEIVVEHFDYIGATAPSD